MATMIVSFDSEQEAQDAISRLMDANVGEVRARVLSSSEVMSHPKTDTTAPMIDPVLGSVEVRQAEMPNIPEAEHSEGDWATATIPTTGGHAEGVQVMIEVDDNVEAEVRRLLGVHAGGQS